MNTRTQKNATQIFLTHFWTAYAAYRRNELEPVRIRPATWAIDGAALVIGYVSDRGGMALSENDQKTVGTYLAKEYLPIVADMMIDNLLKLVQSTDLQECPSVIRSIEIYKEMAGDKDFVLFRKFWKRSGLAQQDLIRVIAHNLFTNCDRFNLLWSALAWKYQELPPEQLVLKMEV